MLVRILVLFIRAYQRGVSPFLGDCCRFHPSCSDYCIVALQQHGILRGLWLGARRIARCHPFNPGGVDNVPVRNGYQDGVGK